LWVLSPVDDPAPGQITESTRSFLPDTGS
jgi:hypothetical protein